ncbi:hypothetical protein MESS2_1590024 [Mesorhizobium metallidurans STM 2683]|uniref:Uncharacterized protein n=1 Tax=Mesorhizobium metallidurans STM 2683 TaxID=1297569 RepID=M5EMG0_9HYPH|nr:hypothetical protein MESS2_1590024 [Mesorhizobium metallidurans STM 2683]
MRIAISFRTKISWGQNSRGQKFKENEKPVKS